jgi:hypothetical protein
MGKELARSTRKELVANPKGRLVIPTIASSPPASAFSALMATSVSIWFPNPTCGRAMDVAVRQPSNDALAEKRLQIHPLSG